MIPRISHRRAATVALVALAAALTALPTASAQLGAAGPYGTMGNYSYYGGMGPYGWGPYSFGWAGYTTAGVRPPMPPPGEPMALGGIAVAPGAASPATASDLLRQQAMAASWRDRRREALRMETKFDVSTGLPRDIPTRVAPSPSLDRRIESLFTPDGTIAWPAGLSSAPASSRAPVERAARIALEQYRLEGRADVADVTFARQALADFASPIFSRLAATDDPLSYQAALSFFQQLDSTLIDLADPPAPTPDPAAPAPNAGAPPEGEPVAEP